MLASGSPPDGLGTDPAALAPPHWSVEPPSAQKSFGINAVVRCMHLLATVPKLAHFFVWKGGFVLIKRVIGSETTAY